jgi:hypothetical protein
MIRFMADSWLEALLRPFIMALPLGGVYVEPIAPDFRFLFAAVLAAVWLFLLVRARQRAAVALLALLAFCAASFVPWMATSGNGRYFVGILLVVGPLIVGLVHQLPLSRSSRIAAVVFMLGAQLFLIRDVAPWHSWGMVEWRDAPAFGVDVPKELVQQPATYVTMTSISYSLIAPAFHPQSHWISLASQHGRSVPAGEARRVKELIDQSPQVYLIYPTPPAQLAAGTRIPDELFDAMDSVLRLHDLRMPADHHCRLMPSRGLTSMGLQPGEAVPVEPELQRGFWLCAVAKAPAGTKPAAPPIDPRAQAVFERIEHMCPRMFPPGNSGSVALPTGARRYYIDSDMRLYVGHDGEVMYKYIRSMNPVTIGTIDEVLAPAFRFDCNSIRGRGMPWEREI